MKMTRWLAAAVAALPLARAGAGPIEPKRVPENAVWVVHLDVERLKQTEVGKFLMEQLKTPDAERQLAAARTVFDFDPRENLLTMTLFGNDFKNPAVVALVQGKFDAERLATLAGGQPNYLQSDYAGSIVHQWDDRNNGRTMFAAFPAEGWIAAGSDGEALKAALDVLGARKPSMAGKAGSFLPAPSNNLPMLTIALSLANAELGADAPPAVKEARSGALTITELAGEVSLDVAVEFANVERAAQVRDLAAGFVAMAAMNAQENPELAELAQKAQITLDGATARLRLRMPAAKLREAVLKTMQEQAPAPAPAPDR